MNFCWYRSLSVISLSLSKKSSAAWRNVLKFLKPAKIAGNNAAGVAEDKDVEDIDVEDIDVEDIDVEDIDIEDEEWEDKGEGEGW